MAARPALRSGGGVGRAQAELARDGLERGDHVRDVLVQLDSELLGALVDLVAVHPRGERRLLELLLHGLRLEALQPGRPDEPAGVDEAAQLVAREERLLEQRVARHCEMLRVGEDGLDDLLRITLLAEDRRAVLRVLVEGRMDLVVEVMEQGGDAPELLVLVELARVEARRSLDREGMAKQRLALRVARQRVPGPVPCRIHAPGRIAASPGRKSPFGARPMQTTAVSDALMESFVIEGGHRVSGTVRAAGNKNGA